MSTVADAAYAHACAVLGPTEPAVEAAIVAVRRGGRVRSAVLGHARAEALRRVGEAAPADVDVEVGDDLSELARTLTFTRPALERAVVDLDTRHALDRAALGRATGLPPALAASKAAEVMLAWQRELDPVVLARLGPAACDELADLLTAAGVWRPPTAEDAVSGDAVFGDAVSGDGDADGDVGEQPDTGDAGDAAVGAARPTVADLLAVGPAVGAHVDGCAACRDRLRAMVSVRTLVGATPIATAPSAVRAAAATSRLRSSSPPPPLDDSPAPLRRWLTAAAVVAAAFVLAISGGLVVAARDRDTTTRVEALTKVPAAGAALDVAPSVVDVAPRSSVRLRNVSDAPVDWSALPDQPWLEVSPPRGRLAGGTTEEIVVSVRRTAPEGQVRAAVTFESADGSIAVVRVETTVSRNPDVAASAEGCAVTATVQDDNELAAVALHWFERVGTERVERQALMAEAAAEGAFAGSLPPTAASQEWWVTATDALGNTGRTPAQTLAAATC
ncbi:MAG TPA: hypothetical protein VF230_00315 [Acidimicrobiales bacterium]